MNISKVRSSFHKPTRVHKKKRREDMDLLEDFKKEAYNDSLDAYEDLKDQLNGAAVLLRKVLDQIGYNRYSDPGHDQELISEIEEFLEEVS